MGKVRVPFDLPQIPTHCRNPRESSPNPTPTCYTRQWCRLRMKFTGFDIIPLFFTLEAGRDPGRSRVGHSTQPIFISSIFFLLFFFFFLLFPSQPASQPLMTSSKTQPSSPHRPSHFGHSAPC